MNVTAEHIKNADAAISVPVDAGMSLFLTRVPNTNSIIPFMNNHTPAAITSAPIDKNGSNHRTAPRTISTAKTVYTSNLLAWDSLLLGHILSINVTAEAKNKPPNTGDKTSYDDMGFNNMAVPNITHDTPSSDISHQKRMSCTRFFTSCFMFSIFHIRFFS